MITTQERVRGEKQLNTIEYKKAGKKDIDW